MPRLLSCHAALWSFQPLRCFTIRRFGPLQVARRLAVVLTFGWTLAVNASQLKAMVALAVLLAVALKVWRPSLIIDAQCEKRAVFGVGSLSGMLGGVSSVTGPIIITYLMALRLEREEFF